jgi:hypothetical protein
MNKNLVGRVLMVGALAFTVACQQPAAPAAGGSGAAAEGTAAEGSAAEGTAAEASAPAAEEGTAAPAAGSGAAMPAAGSGAAAAAPAPRAPTGEPVAAAAVENLHGAWNADIAGMLAAEAANMAPEELAMMQALMGSMQITFTFNADGTASMAMNGMGQSETKGGTYAMTGSNGNQVMFTLTEVAVEGSTAPAPENFTATFQTTNNMTLTKDGDPQVIPFYRQ